MFWFKGIRFAQNWLCLDNWPSNYKWGLWWVCESN